MLRGSDGETAAEFARIFAQSRTHVHLETGKWLSSHFDAETHNFTVTFESGLELSGDQLLIVTGVRANTDTLALDKTGVHVDDDGFIKVDGRLRTSCADIWAFGDCVGNYMFRHSANFESDYLNETVFEMGNPKNAPCIDYTGMPHAVFSSPQLAGVGETEEELQQRNAHYVKGVNPYAKSAMGMALQSEGGFAKLLVDADTRRILGFHVVGPEAANLVHVVIPLMRLHGKLEDLLYCVYVHPALAEIVRNAARRARNALAEREIPMPFLLSIK
jgi:dihydrolipoamide dehydrogenase